MTDLKVKFIKENDDAKMPFVSKQDSACFDFFATEDMVIQPGGSAKIENGIRVIVPSGWFLTFSTRSSMGFMKDAFVYPGILDAGWKGNLAIKLYNFGNETLYISKGDKYAQGRFERVQQVEFEEISFDEFESFECRGGWGSTGQ